MSYFFLFPSDALYSWDPNTWHLNNWTIRIADNWVSGIQMLGSGLLELRFKQNNINNLQNSLTKQKIKTFGLKQKYF